MLPVRSGNTGVTPGVWDVHASCGRVGSLFPSIWFPGASGLHGGAGKGVLALRANGLDR